MTVHFTGPVLNFDKQGGIRKWFSSLPVGHEPSYCILNEDFNNVGFASNADPRNLWTVVKDTGASVANGTDVRNGTVVLSSAATTDNDGASIQTTQEMFSFESGKKCWFEAAFAPTDAEGSAIDIFVGLVENFATNPEAALTASNRAGFQVDDGTLDILCKAEAGDTESSQDSANNIASGTTVTVGMYWDGSATLEFYVDRALVHTMNTTDDNIPTAVNMAAAAFELSGSATGTKSLSVDYIFVAQER